MSTVFGTSTGVAVLRTTLPSGQRLLLCFCVQTGQLHLQVHGRAVHKHCNGLTKDVYTSWRLAHVILQL